VIGPEHLAPLVEDVLRHTLDGEPARAAAVLDRIGEHGDGADMYGVCCAAAEVGRAALLTLFPDAGTADGDMWSLEGAADQLDDPHRLFAARFLTAYANGDAPTGLALFLAAHQAGPQSRTESVCALLAHVHGLCRRAEAGPTIPHHGGTRP